MNKDQILAQMGVTQWRLRQPIARPAGQDTAPEERSKSTAQLTAARQPKQASCEPGQQINTPATELWGPIVEVETGSFNVQAVTVSANAASAPAGKNWVWVFAKRDEDNAQEQRLFNNILKAIDFASLAAVQHNDRQAWLQGLQATQVGLILLMGEAVAAMAFPDKPSIPLYKLLPRQTLQTIAPVLALPSLAQLIEQPKQKREVWAALQQAINLSQ